MMIRFIFWFRTTGCTVVMGNTFRLSDDQTIWAQRPIISGDLGLLNGRRSVDLEKSDRLELRLVTSCTMS